MCHFHAVPPTIAGGDDGPAERKVVLGKPLILECEAAGHPPPSLTWLKDGAPVRDGDIIRVLEQGKKIEIISATMSDSGRYVCVATSIAGEKDVKYDVRVLGTETQRFNLHNHPLHTTRYLLKYSKIKLFQDVDLLVCLCHDLTVHHTSVLVEMYFSIIPTAHK